MKTRSVYIMTNKCRGTLYTGVTSNLIKRVYEHKTGITKGFTEKYNCKQLVFFELYEDMINAITREKQIKKFLRNKRIKLIESMNLGWKDLHLDIA